MEEVFYRIGRLTEEDQLRLDFTDGISRSVLERIELGFVQMKLPLIDDVPYRIFDTLGEYRKWACENLPGWLGYYPADD
jgi:hypothetical protein